MTRGRVVEQEGERKWGPSGRVLEVTARNLDLIPSEMESHQIVLSKEVTTRKQGQSSLKNACKQWQPLPHRTCFIQDLSSSPTTTIITNTPPNPVEPRRERGHLITGHRAANILSSGTSPSSPSVILMGSKCPPPPLLSQGLVSIPLLRTKGKSRMAEVRWAMVGEHPASATVYQGKDIQSSYGSTRCQKIEEFKHFQKGYSLNEGTLQQEFMGWVACPWSVLKLAGRHQDWARSPGPGDCVGQVWQQLSREHP